MGGGNVGCSERDIRRLVKIPIDDAFPLTSQDSAREVAIGRNNSTSNVCTAKSDIEVYFGDSILLSILAKKATDDKYVFMQLFAALLAQAQWMKNCKPPRETYCTEGMLVLGLQVNVYCAFFKSKYLHELQHGLRPTEQATLYQLASFDLACPAARNKFQNYLKFKQFKQLSTRSRWGPADELGRQTTGLFQNKK